MIHITETDSGQAALRIAAIMDAHGGEWIANAVADEGFIVAHVASPDGKRLARSMSPHLTKAFTKEVKVRELAQMLLCARTLREPKVSKFRVRTKKAKVYVEGVTPANAVRDMVVASLRREPMTADRLATEIGTNEVSIRNCIRRMRKLGLVQRKSINVVRRPGCRRYLYQLAA